MTLSMFGHNLKERVASLLVFIILAMMLTFASVTTVNAASQTYGTGCGSANTYFILYENGSNDTSDGNDLLNVCQQITGDTLTIDHFPSGYCNALAKPYDDWDNCISSIRVYIRDTQKALCVYKSKDNWTSNRVLLEKIDYSHTAAFTRWNLTYGDNDSMSSFKWILRTQSC